jgi:hypothetical protein
VPFLFGATQGERKLLGQFFVVSQATTLHQDCQSLTVALVDTSDQTIDATFLSQSFRRKLNHSIAGWNAVGLSTQAGI